MTTEKSLPDDLLELPFDQYQRYRILAATAETLRSGDAPLRILDVGGYLKGGGQDSFAPAQKFLPRDLITVLDIKFDGPGQYVVGSGTDLPFKNKSYDLVAAMDTLEHLPREFRQQFINEMCRVTRQCVLIAGPVFREETVLAEKTLERIIVRIQEMEHPALVEHLTFGLPVIEEIAAALDQNGFSGRSFPDGFLPNWFFMMILKHLLLKLNDPQPVQKMLDRFYNLTMGCHDNREPAYRHVFVYGAPDTGLNFDALTKPAADNPVSEHFGYQLSNLLLVRELATMMETIHQVYATRPSRLELEEMAAERYRFILEKDNIILRLNDQISTKDQRIDDLESRMKDYETLKDTVHHQEKEIIAREGTIQELLSFRERVQQSLIYRIMKKLTP